VEDFPTVNLSELCVQVVQISYSLALIIISLDLISGLLNNICVCCGLLFPCILRLLLLDRFFQLLHRFFSAIDFSLFKVTFGTSFRS
jgi:hypothetical protein